MDISLGMLRSSGYEILWASHRYCRAMITGQEILLKWTGENWIRV